MATFEFTFASRYRTLRINFSRKKAKPQDYIHGPMSMRTILVEAESYQEAKTKAGRLKRFNEKFWEEQKAS